MLTKFVPLSKTLFNPKYQDHPITFGQYLRRARMDEGMQIKVLAQKVEVDEMTIINWEKDKTKPMPANLTQILRICECID